MDGIRMRALPYPFLAENEASNSKISINEYVTFMDGNRDVCFSVSSTYNCCQYSGQSEAVAAHFSQRVCTIARSEPAVERFRILGAEVEGMAYFNAVLNAQRTV